MKAKRIITFIIYIVVAYVLTFQFLQPALIDFSLSDVFIKPTSDTAPKYGLMDNMNNEYAGAAIVQCESLYGQEVDETIEWDINGYSVWALGDYHYLVNSKSIEGTFRFACKVRYYEGEDMNTGWEILEMQYD